MKKHNKYNRAKLFTIFIENAKMILGRYSSERKKKVVVASAFALFNVNSAKQSGHWRLLRVITLAM
ncbi:MAG: hypothetical protein OZ917_04340 [Candidatus Brocadiaceae bacterium]|jgi:hypothetical protein|nr:hypothetical protein [Candidatus Brocadiaceae bacterium]OQZ02767.1 MAG: hypothetical protein B6D34_10405 [Candidatus Brocadia sp. UTAMX1]